MHTTASACTSVSELVLFCACPDGCADSVNRVVKHNEVIPTAVAVATEIIAMASRAGQAHPDPQARHSASLQKIQDIKRGLIFALRNKDLEYSPRL